jgi:hypothetical protein
MSTGSRPPPSIADNPFKSVDRNFILFSPSTKTLRVGARSSVYGGPTLRAASATDLNAASLVEPDPADVYHINDHMFGLLVGGTWNAASAATKSQIQNNKEIGLHTFDRSLTENIEAFANRKTSN